MLKWSLRAVFFERRDCLVPRFRLERVAEDMRKEEIKRERKDLRVDTGGMVSRSLCSLCSSLCLSEFGLYKCGSAKGAEVRWDGTQDGSDGKGSRRAGVKFEQPLILLSRPGTAPGTGSLPPRALEPIACGWLDPGMQFILRTVCALPKWICPTEEALNGHDNAGQRRTLKTCKDRSRKVFCG